MSLIRKLFAIVFWLMLLSTQSPAQEWEWSLAARPDIDIEITGISMLPDGLTGWLVGNNGIIGRIFHTSDGWKTFHEQSNQSGTTLKFKDVCFINDQEGWIVGKSGIILHTIDGGKNWERQGNGVTSHNLNKVTAVDANNVIAAGDHGTLLSTNDGENWSKITGIGTTNDFLGIDMYDAMHGIAVGKGTIIYYTRDGVQWRPAFEVPSVDSKAFNAVAMIDSDTAWAVGDVSSLIQIPVFAKTTDGGNTWEISLPAVTIEEKLRAIDFTSDRRGVAVGSKGYVLTTMDGDTWTVLPRYFGSNNNTVAVIGNKIWTAGLGGNINYSSDFGCSWSFLTKVTNNCLYKTCAINNNRIFAVGYASSIVKTYDGGINWESDAIVVNNILSQQIWGIDFATSDIGWVAGCNGFIAKTIDGGVTWSLQGMNLTGNWLRHIRVYDENTLWIVGDIGKILKSTNSGNNWTIQGTNVSPNNLVDIDGLNENDLAIVGNNSTFLYTNDGGQSWQQSSHDLSSEVKINALHIIDATHAWAVGESGIIMFSSDCGKNWSRQISPDTIPLNDIYFKDDLNGWIVGNNGKIFETKDGGNEWNSIADGITGNPLYSIGVTADDKIFICGYGGVVVSFKPISPGVNVWTPGQVPQSFYLSHNYPNPFNDKTYFQYHLSSVSHINISVYNISGQKVAILLDEVKSAGAYHLTWDAKYLSGGIYFVRMTTPNFSIVRKVLLIK